MDVADIVARATNARTFHAQVGPRLYTLRVPTDHEMRIAYLRHAKGPEDRAGTMLVEREIVERSIVDWRGVTLADVLPDQPPAELPFDAKLVPVLLDAKGEDYVALTQQLFEQISARAKALEADAKN